jgi:ubiquinone/menaquinone biosynthesis methyltransferase
VADLIAEVAARGEQPSQHAVAVRSMFDRISPTYDLLNRVMSAGIDRRWRARALDVLGQELPDGPLLDSCAGTLDLSQALEARFPARPVVAADFSREMLVKGKAKVRRVPLTVGDSMRLPFADAAFAGMTCSFGIRNLSDPAQGLREAFRVLKPGGALVVLEFFRPATPFMRLFHATFARFMLPALGFLISRDREAYGYLARSMQGFYSRAEFAQLGLGAGFARVESEDLSFGIASLIRWVK